MVGITLREPTSACTHLIWFVLAVPGLIPLWMAAGKDPLKRRAAMLYGSTLVFCSGGSFLFHAVPLDFAPLFRTMDHVGIFLLIAGTVSPIGLIVLDGRWRRGLILGIWLFAFVGIALRLHSRQSESMMTVSYLCMGWIGSVTYCELARRLGHAKMKLLWLGGLFYTLGAIINGVGQPILIPGSFESHDLFHVFVMGGSLCHYLYILTVVLPYEGNRSSPARWKKPSTSTEQTSNRFVVLESDH